MDERPTFGDIVASAGLGAICGAGIFSFGLVVFVAFETGRLDNLGWAIVFVPFAMMLGLFTAWPIGIAVGMGISRTLGWGYSHAGLAGALSGLALGWLFDFYDFENSDFSMLAGLTTSGALSGVLAWRSVTKGSEFNRERHP